MEARTLIADYSNGSHAKDIVSLLDHYASDPMGGGVPLSEGIKRRLVPELAARPNAFSILCYIDSRPAGLANCFEGFSTFRCQPLINIHDLVVSREYRGLGISQLLLARVKALGKERGCCKLTLEVLEGNHVARKAYRKFGFSGYELDPAMGTALFWEMDIGKKVTTPPRHSREGGNPENRCMAQNGSPPTRG